MIRLINSLQIPEAHSQIVIGLPIARVVMAVQPGRGERAVQPLPIVPLDSIRPETLLLLVTGSDDEVAGDREAKRIFVHTPQIGPGNKGLVTIVSDYHGTPPLVANHASPRGIEILRERPMVPLGINTRRADALSYYGYWKLLDGLMDAAFHGRHREYALGDTRAQRFMVAPRQGAPEQDLTQVLFTVPLTQKLKPVDMKSAWLAKLLSTALRNVPGAGWP